jgi:hypothetical protein
MTRSEGSVWRMREPQGLGSGCVRSGEMEDLGTRVRYGGDAGARRRHAFGVRGRALELRGVGDANSCIYFSPI